MAQRKPFLLRVSPEVLEEMRRWAAGEMRSLNGQIEYVLRDALRRRGGYDDRDGGAKGKGKGKGKGKRKRKR